MTERKQTKLEQPVYISPVIKPMLSYSREALIDSEAIKIVQYLILPKLNHLHALFPNEERIELQVKLKAGLYLEMLPVPYAYDVYYLSEPVSNLGLFMDIMKRVIEVAANYYGIKSEKPVDADYRSFTKDLDDDTIFYERMMAYKHQELEALMEKARAEKAEKEKAEAEAKAKAEEEARINEVLLYSHNCLQALIASHQVAGNG